MTPQQFIAAYYPTARTMSDATGLEPATFLAQWAHETGRLRNPEPGWAGAPCNLANIRDTPRSFAHYASLTEFTQAAIWTLEQGRPNMNLPVSASNNYYWPVLATKDKSVADQIVALGRSPWDAGHYGSPPGADLAGYANTFSQLLGGDDMTPEEHGWLADIRTQVATAFSNQRIFASLGFDPSLPQSPTLTAITKAIADIKAAIAAAAVGGDAAALAALSSKLDAIAADLAEVKTHVDKDLA